MKPYVWVDHYTKIIKNNTVLDCVNLQLEKGSITALTGRNGSGKTMLLRAIAGLIHPTEGEVWIDEKKLNSRREYPNSMGLMIENMKFWPDLTAYDTLSSIAQIKKYVGRKEITETLERVGLSTTGEKKVKQFSLGMKQRLAIAQAVFEKPELLLLDEPTNALDDEGVILFQELIREERNRGAVIVLVSHIKEDVACMADETYEMKQGKILTL